MKKYTRVVLAGDEGVGKTSILRTLISSDLEVEIHPPVKFPEDQCLEGCRLILIDTNKQTFTSSELERADLILLVYDMSRSETLSSMVAYWMPMISARPDIPVVLVGNKSDKTQKVPSKLLEEIMMTLTVSYRQIETILETSINSLDSLSELFVCAQKMVLYPSFPLYDSLTREISADYRAALELVFRFLDKDCDFLLNDHEIMRMESEVFGHNFDRLETESLKNFIRQQCPHGLTNESINLEGFCFLQQVMLQKLNTNVCWTLLRYYQFGNDLKIHKKISIDPSCHYELNPLAIEFLRKVHSQYSVENLLAIEDLKKIFRRPSPWGDNVDCFVPMTRNGFLNVDSWIGLWKMLTKINPEKASENLLWIGFSDESLERVRNKTVFCAIVVGYTGTGKSSLINRFIEKDFEQLYMPTTCEKSAFNLVEGKGLVLIEIPRIYCDQIVEYRQLCDAVIGVSDGSDASEEYLKSEVKLYKRYIKVLTKSSNEGFIDLSKENPKWLYSKIIKMCLDGHRDRGTAERIGRVSLFKTLGAITLGSFLTAGAIYYYKSRK